MYNKKFFCWLRRSIIGSVFIGAFFSIMPATVFASANVTLAWNSVSDPNVAGFNIYYGGVSGTYTNKTSVGLVTGLTISNLVNGSTYYFAATTYGAAGAESAFSSEVSYTVPAAPANQPPTLNAIGNLTINENAGLQTVSLTGISSGATNENQTLTVTAVSSNTGLIPNPTVNYTSANTTGSLTFTPVANATGLATITVKVNDGGASNNIVTQTFTVTVNAVIPPNQPPTLNPISNLTINENAGLQTVNLSGISSGSASENQTLTVTAVSSNPGLIPNPTVNYTSANTTGSLTFTPVANGTGLATITVTVNDGGASNNIVTQTFTVTVNAVSPGNQPPTLNPISNLTINENAGLQTVNLSGISSGSASENQTLTVTAVSSNPGLIPNPTVNYISANTTGSLTFTPVANGTGLATITVTVNDGGASNNIVTQTFTVTVNAVSPGNQPPTLNPISNLTINENAGLQTVNLSGISSGSASENQTLTVTAVSSNTGLIPNPTINYTSANTTGTLSFAPSANAFGAATITVTVNDGGASNNIVTQTFNVTVNPVNQPPTLSPLANLNINENAGLQTVSLAGISSGAANEAQTLVVTATSSNPALIPNPTVNYTSANAGGSLTFVPVANAFGSAVITVKVNDGGASNNIVTQTFAVTVNAVNQPPTLNAINNLTINENAGVQTVSLAGISSGAANENQILTVTAVSSNAGLIPNPTVNYTSASSTGSLVFTPSVNGNGSAKITVTVNDGGASNNLVTQTFTVTVNPVNQPPTLSPIANLTINENSGLQTVNLAGISSGAANEAQTLIVTAVSSNPGLIPNPTVGYTSANATGSLAFTPVANASGSATITVKVNDGGASNNIVTQTFTVTVNPVSAGGNVVNQSPTLDPIDDIVIHANDGAQTVILTGISAGAGHEGQTISVTASANGAPVISKLAVNYTSPDTNGILTFNPQLETGVAAVTVTVNDGASSNNIATQTFMVTVLPADATANIFATHINATNQPPTLDPIGNMAIHSNDGMQMINLTGIYAGDGNETQPLTITATANGDPVISKLSVHYKSPNTSGSLTFSPQLATGVSTITVSVDNGRANNGVTTQTFTVTVVPPGASLNIVSTPAVITSPINAVKAVVSNPNPTAPTLAPAGFANGQFAFKVAGLTNYQYIVQASTDLVNWVSIRTNTAPFTFVDTNAAKFKQRYYRTVNAQ
jgi:hypothetical protein